MLNYILNILLSNGITLGTAKILANFILLVFVIMTSVAVRFILSKVLLKDVSIYVKKTKLTWDDILLNRKVFKRLFSLIPPLIFYIFIPSFSTEFRTLIEKIVTSYVEIIIVLIVSALLSSANDIYNTFKMAKSKPIKGLVQVLQILVYLLGLIIIISHIIDKSPIIIISGVGALTAVLLIVFKDSLLGLVSGIQLSTNDMIRIGDWIEMPKYDANGEVVDISLNTIKVENFDKTITNIPSYTLISDSFKNWRNMQESGGRRIKRSIFIDASSIEFCDEQMIEKFKNTRYLNKYIIDKQKEIEEYNKNKNIDPTRTINVRRLTNIGTFREYIQLYLNNHPNIHENMIQMVRQLEPGIYGVPLEIYAFTNDTDWLNYEKIQGDIFDHVLSIAPEFNLRIFQNPSGYDMRVAFEESKNKSV
jgi:miniconductance mechanosensitive channel